MKTRTVLSMLGAGIVLLWSGLALATPISSNPPCPQIGFADGCNAIITINANNTSSITITSQPPYDNIEDQLVGIINNTTSAIGSITLSGNNIFGFDGDGAFSSNCTLGVTSPYPCGAPTPGDPTGYAGPGTSFTVVDNNNGTVNFLGGGLLAGGTIFFSLEEAPTVGGFTVIGTHPVSTPEPGNLILFGMGLAALGLIVSLRKRAAAKLVA